MSLETEFLQQIEKHKGVIFKISKMYMDNKNDQEDLFQEIIYQAWKSYPSFQGKSLFSTWLYRVALNTSIVFLRSDKKKINTTDIELSAINKKMENNDVEQQQLELMYKAIQQLGAIDKALIFYYLENYSGKEIAAQMGITEVNVRVKLNRAKQKLKTLINELRTQQ
ncbi:sigma-70 family RNA polymerase sigma factor [Riemerella anatipestifer]|uniref:RNA polymerase sigma factor n=1 Tax=Riemerella anatipestifer TaxID=34085 RepID=UPI0012AE848B|nr:sigma-70 family RNA polymerase sigma factor [Riemerella anatipestifer]MDY3362731.1 sigma-70 family RNA polymerase sigma factor [Riemerella anatipestifer]MDY3521384.1 sigma-70 family RNA polymerase sigma factor [Riemerella anatipestifer]MDY3532591.1 sigma-70 family RNA polymerase sigma factor [Riemerella anatipestifer]MDY3534855.1 sigma-70 family RNA polymerase sigma factor [Riemerella anatipestifer]USL95720.1 sigma-70 family RNA polymerase sigma factor [Riemerella anatipestifer]